MGVEFLLSIFIAWNLFCDHYVCARLCAVNEQRNTFSIYQMVMTLLTLSMLACMLTFFLAR